MLLTSVIIVLREVLEAVLLLSLFMVISSMLELSLRWMRSAIGFGLIGASVYGVYINAVSEWFEGVGQEVVNAFLQFLVYPLLVLSVFLFVRQYRVGSRDNVSLAWLMTACAALSITREGSEILIYMSGFFQSEQMLANVLVGSTIGAAIGISVGVLFYFLLLSQPPRRSVLAIVFLLCFVGAGMCAQATQLLIQADWISISGFIWDSSAIIPEGSVVGQLLYALIGYEATPSIIEVTVYLACLLITSAAAIGASRLSGDQGIVSA